MQIKSRMRLMMQIKSRVRLMIEKKTFIVNLLRSSIGLMSKLWQFK